VVLISFLVWSFHYPSARGLFVYVLVFKCPHKKCSRAQKGAEIQLARLSPKSEMMPPRNLVVKQFLDPGAVCTVTPSRWKQSSASTSSSPTPNVFGIAWYSVRNSLHRCLNFRQRWPLTRCHFLKNKQHILHDILLIIFRNFAFRTSNTIHQNSYLKIVTFHWPVFYQRC
jgi:hypothetical protein